MLEERWGEILDKVLSSFEVIEHTKEKEELAEIETVVFQSPVGKVKLVRILKPAVIDKKVTGATRMGKSRAKFEYIYSDTEKVSKLEAYKEVDGEWETIDPDNLI